MGFDTRDNSTPTLAAEKSIPVVRNARLTVARPALGRASNLKRLGSALLTVFAMVVLITASASAQQASWYVDNTVGSGGDGRSWTSAWNSFASINWSSVHAGDTIYISGGANAQTYTETWSVGASGSSTAPITIAAGQDSGHNGTVIFDFNADGDSSTKVAITVNRNYIRFNGNVGGVNHIQFNNLRNIVNRYAGIAIEGGGTGLVFDHLTFINDNNGIVLDGLSTATEIKNCTFRQIRGDKAIEVNSSTQAFDANLIHDNDIETLYNTATAPGGSGQYVGPDGIWAVDGTSIFNNKIQVSTTALYTSNQHPDMMQVTGDYIKVYGNTFTNVGDSVFDYDCYGNSTPHDILIYNNVFRILTPIDPYPEFFRMYSSGAKPSSLTNIKLLNNDFIDNTGGYHVIRFDTFSGSQTATGIEIKNNIFYNDGDGSSGDAIMNIDNSTGYTSSSFAFDGNIYYQAGKTQYITFRGTSYTTANWIATYEPKGKSGQAPLFVSYSAFTDANDYHLQATDSVAKDAGVDLSAYFNTDKDGVNRPQGAGWDIGAYEFTATNRPAAPTGLTATVH